MKNPYVLSMAWTILLTCVAAYLSYGVDAAPASPPQPPAMKERAALVADHGLGIEIYACPRQRDGSFCGLSQ